MRRRVRFPRPMDFYQTSAYRFRVPFCHTEAVDRERLASDLKDIDAMGNSLLHTTDTQKLKEFKKILDKKSLIYHPDKNMDEASTYYHEYLPIGKWREHVNNALADNTSMSKFKPPLVLPPRQPSESAPSHRREERGATPPVQRDNRRPAPPVQRDNRRPAPPVQRDNRRPATPVQHEYRHPAPPFQHGYGGPAPPVQRWYGGPAPFVQHGYRGPAPFVQHEYRGPAPLYQREFIRRWGSQYSGQMPNSFAPVGFHNHRAYGEAIMV